MMFIFCAVNAQNKLHAHLITGLETPMQGVPSRRCPIATMKRYFDIGSLGRHTRPGHFTSGPASSRFKRTDRHRRTIPSSEEKICKRFLKACKL